MAQKWKWTGTCRVCDQPTYGGEMRNGRRIPRRSIHGPTRRVEVCEACCQFYRRHGSFRVQTRIPQRVRDMVRDADKKGVERVIIHEKTGLQYSSIRSIIDSDGKHRKRRKLRLGE